MWRFKWPKAKGRGKRRGGRFTSNRFKAGVMAVLVVLAPVWSPYVPQAWVQSAPVQVAMAPMHMGFDWVRERLPPGLIDAVAWREWLGPIQTTVGAWLARYLPQVTGDAAPAPDTGHPVVVAEALVTRRDAVGHRDFNRAKQVLPQIYAGAEETFYCGCRYTGNLVDHASCGYQVRAQPARAARIEWEHVVTAWALGHQRRCWQQGGRSHCRKTDALFRQAEGDLVNLVPAIGEVNGDRSNYGFSEWTSRPSNQYGQCQTQVDFANRQVQPRPEVRGWVARTAFYMYETYGLRMSRQEQRLFCAWARSQPVSAWEQLRDQRIRQVQGRGNRFVASPTLLPAYCTGA